MHNIHVVDVRDLPEVPDENTAYRLLPKDLDQGYYDERTDRNVGWITREEQGMLRGKTVGIAGCGGMGGLLNERMLRLGVGEIRVCDSETFDVSNINRQFAAKKGTVGKGKAIETARAMRGISDDTTLVVYPQGVCPETVDHFIAGCDVICDEIEFFVSSARILLHQKARQASVPVFVCDTVGFSANIFFFTPESLTMEEFLGMGYEEALAIETSIRSRTASLNTIEALVSGLIKRFAPRIGSGYYDGNYEDCMRRLLTEGKAPIITTNPPMATGLIANRVLLYLLEKSSINRPVQPMPAMPGFMYFDAARMESEVFSGRWW